MSPVFLATRTHSSNIPDHGKYPVQSARQNKKYTCSTRWHGWACFVPKYSLTPYTHRTHRHLHEECLSSMCLRGCVWGQVRLWVLRLELLFHFALTYFAIVSFITSRQSPKSRSNPDRSIATTITSGPDAMTLAARGWLSMSARSPK